MIGTKELLRLVKECNLVEGLCERELNNPEGAGFDLRVGEVFQIKKGEAFLGVVDRSTPEVKSIAKYGKEKGIVLKPGDYVLVKTIETVNFPNNISSICSPRTTLQRSGVMLITGATDPGYCGELTFAMCNMGKCDFKLEMGARIVRMLFFEVSEVVSQYRGQWQGGRVTTKGKEKQV